MGSLTVWRTLTFRKQGKLPGSALALPLISVLLISWVVQRNMS